MDPAAAAIGAVLYVATSLAHWEIEDPSRLAVDLTVDGVCYRRLDPAYYAWLRDKMHAAKKLAAERRVSAASFEQLRARFNAVHAWALVNFGEVALAQAVRDHDPKSYLPPGVVRVAPRNPAPTPAPLPAPPSPPPPPRAPVQCLLPAA